jgi:hypothetical protein
MSTSFTTNKPRIRGTTRLSQCYPTLTTALRGASAGRSPPLFGVPCVAARGGGSARSVADTMLAIVSSASWRCRRNGPTPRADFLHRDVLKAQSPGCLLSGSVFLGQARKMNSRAQRVKCFALDSRISQKPLMVRAGFAHPALAALVHPWTAQAHHERLLIAERTERSAWVCLLSISTRTKAITDHTPPTATASPA